MSRVHFLNVLEGDCNIIQHDSKRVTVIDVSNASDDNDTPQEIAVRNSAARLQMLNRTYVPNGKVNFNQKREPDNPIDYISGKLRLSEVFRFIVTHPDMDHLDGIRDFFSSFNVINFWDTNHNKQITSFTGSGYNKEDWDFYMSLRGQNSNIKRLTYKSKDSNNYYDEDYLHILAPTNELVSEANRCGDYNDCSYVILYTPPKRNGGNWKILFAGDSHNKTWEYILNDQELKKMVTNIDVLLAPHHGRDSGRNYDFLKVLTPKVTLFGNASSEHLAYDKYPEIRITNNQAGHIILDIGLDHIGIFVKNKEFADAFRKNDKRKWGPSTYSNEVGGWFVGNING